MPPSDPADSGRRTLNRRSFVKAAAGAVAAQQLLAPALRAQSPVEHEGMMYRQLGRTGVLVSAVGFGGYHLGRPVLSEQEGIQLLRQAVDRGITFMDNCWDYNEGTSEIRMGKALAGGYRDKVFLMTKIDGRTRAAAAQQIDESLERLQTDHVDLMQFHEVIRLEDPDRIFAEDGGMEAMLAARQAGKVRFIGFNHAILNSNTVKPIEALHYCLSLPIAVQITGIDSQHVLDQALEAVRTFKPLSEAEVAGILERTRAAAEDGKYELYKTTTNNDGTARRPQYLG